LSWHTSSAFIVERNEGLDRLGIRYGILNFLISAVALSSSSLNKDGPNATPI